MIVLFKGNSRYNVLDIFIDKINDGFKKVGKDTAIIDLKLSDSLSNLIELCKHNECEFFFGFNAVGMDVTIGNNQNLYDVLNVPFVGALVDNPFHQLTRLNFGCKNMLVGCMDRLHCNIVKEKSGYHSFFLPHGACFKDSELKSIENRKIDVLIPATFTSADTVKSEWYAKVSSPIARSLFEGVCEVILSKEFIPIEEAINEVYTSIGYYSPTNNTALYEALYIYVDKFTRAYKREELVKRIMQSEANVLICGSGWENSKFINLVDKNVTIKYDIDFDTIIELMNDSKLVFNMMSNIIDGFHERIFSSMANGAVCLSDSNKALNREFKNDESIAIYSWIEKESIVDKINELIFNSKKSADISYCGRQITLNNHTWENRAKRVVEAVELYKLMKI